MVKYTMHWPTWIVGNDRRINRTWISMKLILHWVRLEYVHDPPNTHTPMPLYIEVNSLPVNTYIMYMPKQYKWENNLDLSGRYE